MPLVPTPKNCDPSVKKAIQILTQKLGLKSVPNFASITLTDLTASSLIGTNASKLLESVTIGLGLDYTTATLKLSHLGIQDLTDPNADKILFWDDSATASAWLSVGNSIAITTTTIDTIQDIRTTATPTFDDLTISTPVNIYALSHDSFADFVANEHIDHTTITLTAGSGIAGGGTIAANRTFDLDINSLAVATIAAGDFVPFWDITATATNKKITFANFETTLNHDSLTGFVSGEHFLQTTITNVSTALATGLLKVTTTTGALSVITDSSANWNTAYTHSQLVAGNPHVVTPTELSLVIGTDVQAFGAALDDLSALTPPASDGQFIVATGVGAFAYESGATARTSIGLGTTDTPQFAKLGINVAASASSLLKVYDVAIDTTATYLGFYNYHQKIAGVTDVSDDFYGIYNVAGYNQSGGVLGDGYGIFNIFLLTDGDVGGVSNARFVAAIYNLTDLNGGKVYGDVFGLEFLIDQEAANEVTGNIYGNYIDIDADGTVGGSVYGLYLNEGSNVDYGIYQNGSAPNVLGVSELGTWPVSAGYAYFGHSSLDQSVAGNYAFMGDSSGSSFFNAATGQTIFLRNNNVTRASINVTHIKFESDIKLKEQAAASADTTAYGQIWVKSDAPNILMYTDDAGTDFTVNVTAV